MSNHSGFSLIELMITIAVLSIIVAIAVPSYQAQVRKARLEEARSLLLENVHFMEQHYAKHGRFKKNSTQWPTLPHTASAYFSIGFTSQAKGEMSDGYRLRAQPVASYQKTEERYLEVDHNGNVQLCGKQDNKNRCEAY
ncbi:MAG: type IV pilin protein [Neisseria sp.]|nr:type IV pilin protein [Neisseria sp.]